MITSRTAALATPVRSLRYGQLKTIVLLFGGYAACYYCRADLSVATPLLVEELGRYGVGHGEALVRIGSMTSLGVLAYALGKLFLTGLGGYWGGRRNFLIGVGGAMLLTLCFAAGGGVPVFRLAWVGNRLTPSAGWAGRIMGSSMSLLRSRAFILVCALSFACTIIRETFNTWTPMYLRDHLGYSVSESAGVSAIFPGVGVASVLLAGWLSDRLGLNGRALLMFLGLGATAAALVVLMSVRPGASTSPLAVTLIGVVAFCLLGPYSYLGGAFALDFGGKQASAASSGIIDGIGYLGGVLAGDSVARVAVAYGWQGVFVGLAAVSAVAAVCAGVLLRLNTRAAHPRAAVAAAAAEATRG